MVFTLAACLLGATTPVSAYPPGAADLQATLIPDVIQANDGESTLAVRNANPRQKLIIKIGRKTLSVKQKGSYRLKITDLNPGIYRVVAISPGNSVKDDTETNQDFLYVPKLKTPKSGSAAATTDITVKFLKPDTVVSVIPVVDGKRKKRISQTVGESNSVKLSIEGGTFVKGSQSYILTVGDVIRDSFPFNAK